MQKAKFKSRIGKLIYRHLDPCLSWILWKKKEDGNWSVSLSDDKLPWKLAQDKATAKNAVKDVKVVCPCEDTY